MDAAIDQTGRAEKAREEVDHRFLKLFDRLTKDCIDKAASCTEQVFSISREFLDKDATELLRQFYDLYFGSETMDERKEEVNRSVDDLIDMIQTNLEEGKDANHNIETSEDEDQERLGLAGLQKKLEGLINMDEGLRNKVIPALATMQFEDAVRQRLEHLITVWETATTKINQDPNLDYKALAKELAEHMTSVEETKDFYDIVVKEPAPEGGALSGSSMLFL